MQLSIRLNGVIFAEVHTPLKMYQFPFQPCSDGIFFVAGLNTVIRLVRFQFNNLNMQKIIVQNLLLKMIRK